MDRTSPLRLSDEDRRATAGELRWAAAGWVLLLIPLSPWLLGGLGVGIPGDGDIAVSVSGWLSLVAMLALVASPAYLPALAISTFGLAASVVCAYRWPAYAPSVSRATAMIAWLGLLAVPVYLLVVLAL